MSIFSFYVTRYMLNALVASDSPKYRLIPRGISMKAEIITTSIDTMCAISL
ncbi:MAG: hypothetical protein JXR63_11275 [Spirochaetales bacterium]|nr:hypothetical protein [Spirochaetales bacterium]